MYAHVDVCLLGAGLLSPQLEQGPNSTDKSKRIAEHQAPEFVPSLSMQFSKISPAPNASHPLTSSYTPRSAVSLPPLTVHWYQQYFSPLGPGTAVGMV